MSKLYEYQAQIATKVALKMPIEPLKEISYKLELANDSFQ